MLPLGWNLLEAFAAMFDVTTERLRSMRASGLSWTDILDTISNGAEIRDMLLSEPTFDSLEYWRNNMSVIHRKGRGGRSPERSTGPTSSSTCGKGSRDLTALVADLKAEAERRAALCRCGHAARRGFKTCEDCAAKKRAKGQSWYKRRESSAAIRSMGADHLGAREQADLPGDLRP